MSGQQYQENDAPSEPPPPYDPSWQSNPPYDPSWQSNPPYDPSWQSNPPYDPSWQSNAPTSPGDVRVGIPGVGPQEIIPHGPNGASVPSAPKLPPYSPSQETGFHYPPGASNHGNNGMALQDPSTAYPMYPPQSGGGFEYPPVPHSSSPGYPPPSTSAPADLPPNNSWSGYPPTDASGPTYPPPGMGAGYPPTPASQGIPMIPITGSVPPRPGPIPDESCSVEGKMVHLVRRDALPDEAIEWGNFGTLDYQKEESAESESGMHSCCYFIGFLGYCGVFACIGVLIWKTLGPYHPTELAIVLPAVFLAVGYILALIEGCFSRTSDYISNLSTAEEIREHIDTQRRRVPSIEWSVSCYHYETRTRHYTTTENGQTVHKTETERVRVESYSATKSFHFDECYDASGNIDTFIKGTVTRVDFAYAYGFMDPHSESLFRREKQMFYDSNRHRDEYMDTDQEIQMTGEKHYMSINMRQEEGLGCMKWHYYCCATLCFLTLPYRIWYKSNTLKRDFVFLKVLKASR